MISFFRIITDISNYDNYIYFEIITCPLSMSRISFKLHWLFFGGLKQMLSSNIRKLALYFFNVSNIEVGVCKA